MLSRRKQLQVAQVVREVRAATEPLPNPDHAWKALSLVNEWIRHCDAKAGVTLAFTGALGTILFNLVRSATERGIWFDGLVVLAAALLLLTAGFCAWTLTPRVDDRAAEPESINRLFFGSIATSFKDTRAEYRKALATLTTDPHELTQDLADQIHANARIATVKATWARRAVRSAIAAGLIIALIAIYIGIMSF